MKKMSEQIPEGTCEECYQKIPNNAENNYTYGYYSGGKMRCWNCCSKRLSK